MSRPIHWEPLCAGDPVPGDPDQVERSGREYQRVADAIEASVARLTHIADQAEMQSDAVDAFRDQARQVAADIRRAQHRYRGVGDALVAYSEPLRIAQDDSARALAAAKDAEADLQAGRTKAGAGRADALRAPTGTDLQDVNRVLSLADGAIEEAQHRLEQARTRCQRAQEDRDHAAARAVAAIQMVKSSGDLNDSWWDDWGSKRVAQITEVAGATATIAGLVAAALTLIPVIGPELAAVVGAIALIASVISLLGNLALASTGYGEWSAVAFDAIGVATFGVGSALAGGARGAYAATKGASRLAAGRSCALPPAARLARGLPGGASGPALRSILGDELANVSRGSARRMVRAGRNTHLSLRAPFLTAGRDIREIPANLKYAFTPANIAEALRTAPKTWQRFVAADTLSKASLALGDVEAAAHGKFLNLLPTAIREMEEVSTMAGRAQRITVVRTTSATISTGLDLFQLDDSYHIVSSPPIETSLELLHLPEDLSVR